MCISTGDVVCDTTVTDQYCIACDYTATFRAIELTPSEIMNGFYDSDGIRYTYGIYVNIKILVSMKVECTCTYHWMTYQFQLK